MRDYLQIPKSPVVWRAENENRLVEEQASPRERGEGNCVR